jgi:hypothetical protein
LNEIADGVWVDEAPVSIVGMPLTSTMTVLRLADDRLLLHSPVELTSRRRDAVEALGTVAHVYAPSLFHHLRAGEWAEAFPSARVHGPPGLAKKRPDLRIDRIHGEPEPDFDALLDEVAVDGFRLGESVLLYRPAKTLVVADLVHNIGRPDNLWTRIYAGAAGFYGRVALSRVIRMIGFSDRTAARRSLDAILALPFERIVVGHGAPISEGARDALAAAYTWLR